MLLLVFLEQADGILLNNSSKLLLYNIFNYAFISLKSLLYFLTFACDKFKMVNLSKEKTVESQMYNIYI